MKFYHLWTFLTITFYVNVVTGYISYNEYEFISNLTKNYNSRIRPVKDRSEKLIIGLEFGLASIMGLDEKKEMLSFQAWVSMNWTDSYLKWNLTDKDIPESIYVPVSDVWRPSLYLSISLSGEKYLRDDEEKAEIFHTGSINTYVTGRFHTHCAVNVEKFPFDSQTCKLALYTRTSSKSGEYLEILNSSVLLYAFEKNPEWKLADTSFHLRTYEGFKQKYARVTLTLERRTRFYILNTILPIVFLSFLNTFTFLLPEDSGEKMSFSISILLSYAVFLTSIRSYLPENSNHVCFFSVYLTTSMLISTLTSLTAISILALHSRLQKGMKFPKWLRLCSWNASVASQDISSDITCTDALLLSRCNKVAFYVFLLLALVNNAFFYIVVTF